MGKQWFTVIQQAFTGIQKPGKKNWTSFFKENKSDVCLCKTCCHALMCCGSIATVSVVCCYVVARVFCVVTD